MRSDSLFGYNFQISYDNKIVKFTDALYINTLSEFFDYKSVFINSKEGKVNGYAITMGMEPIYGNRPLLALNGLWIGDCPDTTTINIDYIEFTDEFKIIIDTLKPTKLIGEIFYSPERIFEIGITSDTIKFDDKKGIIDLNVHIPKNSKLTDFSIIGIYDPNVISFDSITSNSNDIVIEDYKYTENLVRINCKNLFDIGNIHKISFYLNVNTENHLTKVEFYPEYDSTCRCLSGYKTDSVALIYVKEVSSVEEENNYIKIDECYIYDIVGKLVSRIDNQKSFFGLENKLGFLNRGIYYVICRYNSSTIIKRKIYVNY